jgi:TolB-like protein
VVKPSAYQGDEPYIFVCYAHEDADTVYPEIEYLQAEGVNVWYDEGISLGTEWTEALADAIEGCTKFLFFVTPNSVTREHCRRELNFAQEEGRDVMAVHLRPTEVPAGLRLSLNNRQAIFRQEVGEPQYRHALLNALGTSGAEQAPKTEIPASSTSPRWAIYAAAAFLVVVAGGWWLRAPMEQSPADMDETASIDGRAKEAPQNSIAVLPFDNLSPESDDAYFAAGIHDEIVTQLGKVRGLSVIARSAVLGYANSDKPMPQIASELNVNAIMTGSLRYAADQVRLTVQLVDAASGAQLWSEGYQERLEDVFDIQTAIARRIASTLEVGTSPGDPALVSRPPTTNAKAYAHYLRANSMAWGGLNPFDLVYAELDRAIDADPEFASAYASKAFYQAVMGIPGEPDQVSYDQARHAHARLAGNPKDALR